MFKKILAGLAALLAIGGIAFAIMLWPDFSARSATLKTLSDPNVQLTDYTTPEIAAQLQADHYRVVLDSDDQGSAGTAAYAMRINGVEYWVELTERGRVFPHHTLKRISLFQTDGSN